MSNISNKILDAVGILVDKAVASAGYDKTIKATIVNVVDQARGEYKVKYQNGIFSAYTSSPDITYADGAVVYVTIPQNDTSKEKIITGAVKNKGINPVIDTTVDLEYSIIGENCIDAHEEFGLRSHLNEDRIICYDYNNSSNNKIMLNIDAINEYIKTRGYLMCGMTVRTSLPEYQKMRGDYGMKLTLAFVNSSSNSELINREYIFDDESMVGDPYNFISSTRQLKVFEIDNDNFSHVVGIELFAKNFPTQDDTKPADIFINNLEMYAAEVNSTSAEAFSLVINTPDGDTFTEVSANGTKRLRAQAKKQGMNITEDIPYYWFIKDVTVTASSLKYDRRGGQGWACLNPYNIISDTVREYVGGTNEIKLNINNVPTKTTEFKCVAVYENNNIIGTRVIKNSVSNIDVNIVSSNGTQFYLNTGETTLTCNVTIDGDIQELDNATYSWAAVDHNGVFTALGGDKSLDVRAVDIDIYKTYSCSVYYNGALLGTSDIKITNSLKADNSNFRLIIENGDAVFLYNEAGVAPNDLSVAVPITIKPLSFTLYDNFGNAIPSENIDASASKWIMPTENTLLKPARDANGNDNMIEIGDIKYKNGLQFEYNIERLYDAYKNNNNITLEIQYQGNTFRTQTNFTFIKQGDPGTNGTDTYCKIVLNTDEELKSDYPTVLVKADKTWTVSPTPAAENQWFKVQLYRGSELLTETIETNSVATVVWSVLTNVDTVTNLEIEATSGRIMYYPEVTEDNRSNIIKVAVTYANSDGRVLTCYDTIPVVSVILNNNSEVNTNWENIYLKKNTGTKYIIYQSDGTNPTIVGSSYELRVSEKYRCTWRSYFEEGYHQIIQQNSNICELARRYVPTFFNGYRTDKYITCSLYNKTDTPFAVRAIVHIPIHFLLNRYELASLNGWDGNSIDINQEGQYILAPQIGAGHKNEDGNNQFTGVVMGDVYTHNGQEEKLETGLFGYKDGQRSIFLDAETGKAEFGIDGASKIILDPTDNTAVIRSGNYIIGNSGLEIDFSTPTIQYGNGNFSVNEEGHLVAQGGGSIAGWNIGNNELTKNNVGLNSGHGDNVDTVVFWAGKDSANKATAPFRVTYSGILHATGADIEGVLTAGDNSKIGGFTISGDNLTSGSISIGPEQLKYGSNFTVSSAGVLSATGANLTTATISGTLTAGANSKIGNFIISSDGYLIDDTQSTWIGADGIWLGKISSSGSGDSNYNFVVKKNGTLTAKGATLTTANVTGTITSGNLTATGGKIGGVTIESPSSTSGGLYAFSNSSTGWGLWSHTAHANIAIYAGADTNGIGGAPFRVYHNGAVVADSLTASGTLTAGVGSSIGGWIFANKVISSFPSSPCLTGTAAIGTVIGNQSLTVDLTVYGVQVTYQSGTTVFKSWLDIIGA